MNEEETRAMLVECMRTRKYRKEARNSLYGYVNRTVLSNPGYVHGSHIQLMCNTIQSFIENNDRRGLIITTPPRHMKSTICSECLPAWYLSKDPVNREVVIASYNQMQARKMARACRMRFDEPMHKEAFPDVTITVDNADEIMLGGKLNGRPSLIAAGIGTGLTGSGADLAIIDDPIKDMEEAMSMTIKDKIEEWYKSVVVTRLSPGAKILIVMTRWAWDDLVGRVLNDDPEQWSILHLPAIKDDGTALWPERYSLDELLRRKQAVGTRVFESLYQGHPTPLEGGMFKSTWVHYSEPMDSDANRIRAWDLAASHERGDYTVGALIAEKEGRFCIEDLVRLQGSPYEVQQVIRQTAERDGPDVPIRMEQEPGSAGVNNIDNYARNVLRGYDFRPVSPSGSKEVRASAMAAAMENGNLSMVRATWNRELVDELIQFPLSDHDDQVDACAHAFNALALDQATTNVYFV